MKWRPGVFLQLCPRGFHPGSALLTRLITWVFKTVPFVVWLTCRLLWTFILLNVSQMLFVRRLKPADWLTLILFLSVLGDVGATRRSWISCKEAFCRIIRLNILFVNLCIEPSKSITTQEKPYIYKLKKLVNQSFCFLFICREREAVG